ncbi:endonuclease-reverse transcriptase [Plakobranchus ocellatus]|uniref:Endonuclease-reverse transcriptase n=1 Tax=Plakobranchus ocellatus TaxID=259542 RepID=A0AAV4CX70_9GAST|nr:endonuclease-reverse transcriptase [Plakobranchus ocellatus]
MTEALEQHEGAVSFGGKITTNLQIVDNIDVIAGNEQELANMVNNLGTASYDHGMEISSEKTKIMTKSTASSQPTSKLKTINLRMSQTSSTWDPLFQMKEPEILSKLAQTTATLTELKYMWRNRNITLSSTIRLM